MKNLVFIWAGRCPATKLYFRSYLAAKVVHVATSNSSCANSHNVLAPRTDQDKSASTRFPLYLTNRLPLLGAAMCPDPLQTGEATSHFWPNHLLGLPRKSEEAAGTYYFAEFFLLPVIWLGYHHHMDKGLTLGENRNQKEPESLTTSWSHRLSHPRCPPPDLLHKTKMSSYHVHTVPVQICYDMQLNSISTFTTVINSGQVTKSGLGLLFAKGEQITKFVDPTSVPNPQCGPVAAGKHLELWFSKVSFLDWKLIRNTNSQPLAHI